jgi:NAD+ kinase
MRVGLVGNASKTQQEAAIEQLQTYLQENGYTVTRFMSHLDIEGVDVVIVLGGDGAILHAAVVAAQKSIKVIGINYGTLGFLTEYERDNAKNVLALLKSLQENSCRILKRSLVKVSVKGKTYYALNELAVQRHLLPVSKMSSQLMQVEVQLDGESDVIAGDGVLICTPTGSTAFSLSAGGAIICPETKVFMMTPICAFSMRSRPIVFSDDEKIALRIQKGEALILIDGKAMETLAEGEEILVEKAPFYAEFPVHNDSGFLSKIRNKLNK